MNDSPRWASISTRFCAAAIDALMTKATTIRIICTPDRIGSCEKVDPKSTELTLPDDPAAAAALLLIEGDQVSAIIGDLTTDATLSAAPECQRFHIPLITPTSISPKISRTQNFIFRSCFSSDAQAPWIAHIAGQSLGARRAAL